MYDHLLLAFGDPGASETVVTSKEGSRRATCPNLTEAGFCASFFMARYVVLQHLNKAWPSRCGWVSGGRGCCVSRRVCPSCPWARSKRPRVCPQNTRHMFDTCGCSADTHGDVLNVSTRTLRCVVTVSSCGVVVTRTCRGRCRLLVEIVMLSSRCCDEGQQDRHVVVLNTTGNHTPLTAHTVNHNKTVLQPPQSHRNHRRAIRKAIWMALGWFGWLWDGSI